MIDQAITVLTFAAAIGCGLVAGIFFAFSSFVMPALGRVPSEHGIPVMQSINVVVINRSFMTAFLGTAALSIALAAGSYFWWEKASGKLILVASLTYLVGVVGVTRIFNIPLNVALAQIEPGAAHAADVWAHYLDRWTFWNTVRTVLPAASMFLFILALVVAPAR